jgi:L-aspartate oxidase
MRHQETDVLVVGSGIAGLTFALEASRYARVLVLTKKARGDTNTNYAQGGIAAVVAPGDSPELHVRDTLLAGAGLCHRPAVETVVGEGPDRVRELMDLGVEFSRDQGDLALGMEGGHSRRRILHSADLTGREIESALISAVSEAEGITVLDDHFVWSLRAAPDPESGTPRCTGVLALDVSQNDP